MDAAAVTHHEFFMSYVRAGFTRAEAVQVLIAVITATVTAAGPGGTAGLRGSSARQEGASRPPSRPGRQGAQRPGQWSQGVRGNPLGRPPPGPWPPRAAVPQGPGPTLPSSKSAPALFSPGNPPAT